MAEPIITSVAPPAERRERKRLSFPAAARCASRAMRSPIASSVSNTGAPTPKLRWCTNRSATTTNARPTVSPDWPTGSRRHGVRRSRRWGAHRPPGTQCPGRAAADHAGRPDTVPATGADHTQGNVIEVGTDALPEVVLEVDHTTDVRRGKLGLYEAWGFGGGVGGGTGRACAEPAGGASSRPHDLRARAGGVASGASEPRVSGVDGGGDSPGVERTGVVGRETAGVLNRVGRCWVPRKARGRMAIRSCVVSAVRATPRVRAEAQRASALQVLKSRGVSVSASLAVRLAELEGVSGALGGCGAGVPGRGAFVQLLLARRDGRAPRPCVPDRCLTALPCVCNGIGVGTRTDADDA